MNDPTIELILVSAALLVLVVSAFCIRGVARVFLVAQVVYWTLSYVARPLVLLTVQPQPRYADNIADPRLATIGYDHGVEEVLRPVAFGLWVYAAVVAAYAIHFRRHHRTESPPRTADDFISTFATVYVMGILGRGLSYLTGSTGQAGDIQSTNALMGFVASFGSLGAIGLIIFVRPAQLRTTIVILGALVAGELLWTVVVESKTPITGAALAIAIRFAMSGWNRIRVASIIVISVVGVGAFGWLQSIKQPDYVQAEVLSRDSAYPASLQPFLGILRRFDLFEAATDSYYMTTRIWLTPAEVLLHGFQSLIPAQLLGSEKLRSGTAWALQVRGSSMDMTKVSVSLADGNINEGFVVAGYAGVAIGVLFTFGLLLFCTRALISRHIVVVTLGLAIAASPILFERGFLGSMEVIGKSLQLVVLVWLVDMAIREYRKRTTRSKHQGPVLPDVSTTVEASIEGKSHGIQ